MSTYILFLRGINVVGKNLLAMSDLRDLLGTMGFSGVKSILQSGNLIIQSDGQRREAIEQLLENELQRHVRNPIDCTVRTPRELNAVISRNPFPRQARRDPSHLLVMFFKSAPKTSDVESLRLAIQGPEQLRADGKHLYLVYPTGIGTSKLSSNLIERKLGLRGTARNWNTILKLSALTAE